MKAKPNLSLRTSRPQSLGGAFGGLLKIFGVRASDADLAARWNEIIGADLARLAKLQGIRSVGAHSCAPSVAKRPIKRAQKCAPTKFNITLKAVQPAFAMELSYRTEEFRARINKYFGYDAVGKITVKK
ncbi:MAG: DUF721 domain-containing protein [Alphaproteobacteria bacterium]|nr:DUF721 domain-containing protein [Alphaproteobacteria bacterium]